MTSLSNFSSLTVTDNPLDLAESLFEDREWLCDRPVDEELVAEIEGGWCNYRIWCSWQSELEVMMFACAMENKIPKAALPKLHALLAKINEKLWLGHFDICSQEHIIIFRHALMLRGGNGASPEQIEDLIDIAMTECDRFYPAFQSVAWGGGTSESTLKIALMETVGEA